MRRKLRRSSFSRSLSLLALPALLLAASAAGCLTATPQPASTQPTPAPSAAPAAALAMPLAKGPWLVESFESPQGTSGGFWCAFDTNKLGTQVSPDPFVLEHAGAPPSPGGSARFFGTLGENRPPYSWAQLQVFLNPTKAPQDLRGYRSIRFWVKGDGGRYSVALSKQAVTDYDHFKQEFVAPSSWTEVALPMSGFAQAGWGKKLPAVFEDVNQIQFAPAAFSHPFDLAVDHIELSPDDVKVEPVAYKTADWFAYRGTDPVKRRGTALDVSRLLDAPAGKHGPLKRQGENFVFANGKPIRFWGVNVVASANFPTHEEADKLAELLAQMGVNVTRHHHMDAPWSNPNVFGNGDSTLALDEKAMERFDYLVAALQKRGIYQFFDMLVHRKATAKDGVTSPDVVNGFKVEGEFDPQLIALQEKFVEQFMGHQNPYTKRSYAKDPAVAMLEVINEDSLFWIQKDGDFAISSPESRALLTKQFSAWLGKQVPGGRTALEKRWQPDAAGGQGLGAKEDPAAGNVDAVVMFASDDPKRLSKPRSADTLRFYYDSVLGYYRRIQSKLKQLGYQGLVTGSNHWVETPIDLFVNAQLDYVDRHSYWSHPNGGWGYSAEISWDPSSMLKDSGLGIVGSIAARRVKGLPYAASEWQTSAPNDYRHEGVLAMGAYAALGNVSPIQFAFSHDVSKKPDAIAKLTGNFDVIEQPTMLGAWPAVSLLFHRRDVAESKLEAVLKVTDQNVFDPLFRDGAPKELGRLGKTGVGFGQGQSLDELRKLLATKIKDGVAVANGGELVHSAKEGTLVVNTERTQAFAGFSPQGTVQLKNVDLKLQNKFAVVIISSLDDKPLAVSKRILVSALGNAVNQGMTLSPSRNRLQNSGSSPVLVEPIVGQLTLTGLTATGKAKVHALGPNGERDHAVKAAETAGGVGFGLSAEHRAMHYEIVRD